MFLILKKYWRVKNTKQKGKGVFANKSIPAGTVIGDYIGNLIRLENIDYEKEKEGMYLMYFNDEFGIYPDLDKDGIHLINHSCSPNCWLYTYQGHTLFFALREINADEELTINYLLPPKKFCEPCVHSCHCNSKNCLGSMHLSEGKYKKWKEFQHKELRNTGIKEASPKSKMLIPLSNYPKSISKNYTEKILGLKI